jgi:hypothetical protein
MVPPNKFLDALSLLPAIRRVRRQARHTWDGNIPIQLEFALVGGQIASYILAFTDDERSYIRGVLDYALKMDSKDLRPLVLRPLLTTLFERSRRMGKEYEAAVFQHLYIPGRAEASSLA